MSVTTVFPICCWVRGNLWKASHVSFVSRLHSVSSKKWLALPVSLHKRKRTVDSFSQSYFLCFVRHPAEQNIVVISNRGTFSSSLWLFLLSLTNTSSLNLRNKFLVFCQITGWAWYALSGSKIESFSISSVRRETQRKTLCLRLRRHTNIVCYA